MRSAELGGTGYQPVAARLPAGRKEGSVALEQACQNIGCSLPFRAAGSRAAQAGCLCYPANSEIAIHVRATPRPMFLRTPALLSECWSGVKFHSLKNIINTNFSN